MPHSFFLCSQVSFIIRIRNCFNRYIFYYLQSVCFQTNTFHRIICQKSHFVYSQFTKDLCAYSVITLIGKVSQTNIRVNGIHTVFLQLICFHLFHQTDATSFLIEVNHHAFSFFFDHFHRFMQLLSTVTTL